MEDIQLQMGQRAGVRIDDETLTNAIEGIAKQNNMDLAQFTQARELAAIGEDAARRQVPKIKQLLGRLDPQLFRQTADAANLQKAGPITSGRNT